MPDDLSSSEGPPAQGAHGRLLAWHWVIAALAVLAVSTFVAAYQDPAPVPPNRGTPSFSFLQPVETNPHRRLIRVQESLRGVHFTPDGKRGWAVGDAGRIVATLNDGIDWTVQASGRSEMLTTVVFEADGQRGWAGSDDMALLATNDGGNAWRPLNKPWDALARSERTNVRPRQKPPGVNRAGRPSRPLPPEEMQVWTGNAADIFRVDRLNVWRVDRASGDLEHTADNGKSWTRFTTTRDPKVHAIHMAADGMQGWAVGANGAIIATTDGWRTWHPQTANVQPGLFGLWLDPDGKRAWAVGSGGTILATSDGGGTWVRQAVGAAVPLDAVGFAADGAHGWAAGGSGVVMATADGGRQWELLPRPTSDHILGLHVYDNGRRGWVVDDTGARFAFDNGTWRSLPKWDDGTVPASVQFDAAGQHGWAVNLARLQEKRAAYGALLETRNGGARWEVVPTDARLRSVSMDRSGPGGFAVVDMTDGQSLALFSDLGLAATRNAGATWARHPGTIARGMAAVRAGPDARNGLAVGARGRILATDDGGATWHYAEQYRRLPAPWYWLAVALSAGLIWTAWARRPLPKPRESVVNMAATDAEVRSFDQDRLNFGGLARGISRFIRNAETQPPLTLAITGRWGTGKSSLMQLICADMRRFHHRPIWFNAWHHQKEEHLFAALLGAVYAQAAPPLFSIAGAGFRMRLLWLRSRRHFGAVLAALLALSCAGAFGWNALDGGGIPDVTASVRTLGKQLAPSAAELSALTAALTALVAIIHGATPLRINPAVLLGAAREHMSLKVATAQNDFRERFARQFEEVTRALRYKMVIVIDDLDRCRPGAVIEVMETVNYLTSAGQCFVIFGMARERVIAALGLAFKEIAGEFVQMEERNEEPPTDGSDPAELERLERKDYANDYLQKLVNIEVKVPSGPHQQQLDLFRESRAPSRSALLIDRLASAAPLAACAAVVLAGAALGYLGHERVRGPEPTAASAQPTLATSASGPAPAAPLSAPQVPRERTATPAVQLAAEPGERLSLASRLQWIGASIATCFLAALLVGLRILRQSINKTEDSPEFRDALSIWLPVVGAYHPTPRSNKRFFNRLRYLAMLQQGEAGEKTLLDLLRERFARLRGQTPGAAQDQDALTEAQLIAIGAMYEIFGKHWEQRTATLFPAPWFDGQPAEAGTEQQGSAIVTAAKEHRRRFGLDWPPTKREVAVFERLIAGVWLDGDPRPIVPQAAPGGSDSAREEPARQEQAREEPARWGRAGMGGRDISAQGNAQGSAQSSGSKRR